jgi:hypothetical protein
LACWGDNQSHIVQCCEVLKPGTKQGLARNSKRPPPCMFMMFVQLNQRFVLVKVRAEKGDSTDK